MTIAVLGATGHLGGHVIDALLARGVEAGGIRALGRNAGRLSEITARGLQTAPADLDDPASLREALDGADVALLISGSAIGRRVAQHTNAIEAAKEVGVQQLVYTSAPNAKDTALILAPEHKATEEVLEASGLVYTVLRNGWYTENYEADFAQAREHGVIRNSVGDGRVASAPRRDYAEAAAVVLTSEGHDNAVYELSGDVAWTFTDFAAAASAVLSTPVHYEAVTPEQERESLQAAGLDEGTIGFVSGLNQNIRDGLLGVVNGELSALIGHPTEPLETTLRSWV